MKPVRSEAHLAWIRSLPCVVASVTVIRRHRQLTCAHWIEAAHVGPHGISQKASDLDTIPLCRHHHEELHKNGRMAFESKYLLSFHEILERLRKKPRIRIHHRPGMIGHFWFMAEFEGETFWLCPVAFQQEPIGRNYPPLSYGLKSAWRICKELCCKDRLRMAS